MTNEQARSSNVADAIQSAPTPDTGGIRFAMVALYVDDLQRSVDFYRLAGLAIPDPHPDRPVVSYREGEERRMIIATNQVGDSFDHDRVTPDGTGYRQVIEFFVDSDAAVDSAWHRLTSAGHVGVAAPASPNGAYATLVQDPDANVVMITHEPGQEEHPRSPDHG